MRLLRVELRRLFSRRAVWLALVAAAAVVVMALYGVHQQAVWFNESRATAQEQLEEALTSWEQSSEADVAQCQQEEDRARRESGDARVDFGCEEMARPPQLQDFISQMPSMVEQYRQLLTYLVYPFLFLALAVGSTHVAAEFVHRTLGSWLTFVPRRVPVFVSKVLGAAVAAVPMVLAGLTLVLLGVPAVLRVHGIDDGLTAQDWTSVAWMALRVVALAMLAGAFGAAAAFLLRHSGVVIGLMVGYLMLVEGILRTMFPATTPWTLGLNIQAVVQDGTQWSEWPQQCDDITVPCREIVHQVSLSHGLLVLLGLALVVAVLALVVFRRADVD